MKKPVVLKKQPNFTTVTNCSFTGVQWDAKATGSIHLVAAALLNLTELFKSQNIQVGPMIHVCDGQTKVKP